MEYLKTLYAGRLNRRTYFVGGIILGVIYYILLYIARLLGTNIISELLSLIVILLAIVVGFSLSARRFHDMGQSGWLSLLLIIPLFNILVAIYLLLMPGKSGSNAYGPQPADKLELQKVYQYKY